VDYSDLGGVLLQTPPVRFSLSHGSFIRFVFFLFHLIVLDYHRCWLLLLYFDYAFLGSRPHYYRLVPMLRSPFLYWLSGRISFSFYPTIPNCLHISSRTTYLYGYHLQLLDVFKFLSTCYAYEHRSTINDWRIMGKGMRVYVILNDTKVKMNERYDTLPEKNAKNHTPSPYFVFLLFHSTTSSSFHPLSESKSYIGDDTFPPSDGWLLPLPSN